MTFSLCSHDRCLNILSNDLGKFCIEKVVAIFRKLQRILLQILVKIDVGLSINHWLWSLEYFRAGFWLERQGVIFETKLGNKSVEKLAANQGIISVHTERLFIIKIYYSIFILLFSILISITFLTISSTFILYVNILQVFLCDLSVIYNIIMSKNVFILKFSSMSQNWEGWSTNTENSKKNAHKIPQTAQPIFFSKESLRNASNFGARWVSLCLCSSDISARFQRWIWAVQPLLAKVNG